MVDDNQFLKLAWSPVYSIIPVTYKILVPSAGIDRIKRSTSIRIKLPIGVHLVTVHPVSHYLNLASVKVTVRGEKEIVSHS